jgi:hypothetical protein
VSTVPLETTVSQFQPPGERSVVEDADPFVGYIVAVCMVWAVGIVGYVRLLYVERAVLGSKSVGNQGRPQSTNDPTESVSMDTLSADRTVTVGRP